MAASSDVKLQFKAISDQVFIHKGDIDQGQIQPAKPTSDPDVIIIYGWGDAGLKHVSKYTTGFHTLFPHAKIIAVLSPILKTMTQNLDQRVRSMQPVVDEVFGNDDNSIDRQTILIHVMSNTGGMNIGATFEAYRRKYQRPMPHNLLVLDSTPGSTEYNVPNVKRFAFAMTVGTAAYFPWPKAVTQWLWFVILYMIRGLELLIGRESSANFAVKAVNSLSLATTDAARLYLYSKEDAIIYWKDIEEHSVAASEIGYRVDWRVFAGSAHVGHMRLWPEEYWKAIMNSWVTRNPGQLESQIAV